MQSCTHVHSALSYVSYQQHVSQCHDSCVMHEMCCVQNIKKKYPLVLSRINQLVERIKVLGPQTAIDVDQAALRVTLDVIGLVSVGSSQRAAGAS